MKLLQTIKSNLLLSVIILLVIILLIILIIILLIYFLVIKKSSSQEQPTTTQFIVPTINPKQLGFIYTSTNNHVDSPKKFIDLYMFNTLSYGKEADNGIVNESSQIQYKWAYDKNNINTLERIILNKNNGYTQNELSSLGETNKPNTYLVNKLVTKYDKNNVNLSINVDMDINPMILTTYENYKK